jgi:hypothetical protein
MSKDSNKRTERDASVADDLRGDLEKKFGSIRTQVSTKTEGR